MSKAFWIGLILLVAGLVVALRGASYKEHKGVGIGDVKIHVEERHAVPTWIGWTAAGAGLILVVTGLRGRGGSSVVRDQTPHTTP
jgi:hypothetical protein